MIADAIINKKFNPLVTELLMRGRKIKISPSGVSQLIQQIKFTYSPLGNLLENQPNTIKEHEESN